MSEIDYWILTFNRPVALNRLVKKLNTQGIVPAIFSNYPVVKLDPEVHGTPLINTLNHPNSNSWCARSWNTIYMKSFINRAYDAVVCLQDDTDISDNFVEWINYWTYFPDDRGNLKFISGPAGDQFHYIHKDVLREIGWWDERYIGCYCGDADYFKRVQLEFSDQTKISIQDSHNWGWTHHPIGVEKYVLTEMHQKSCDPNYENQHWQLEKISNKTLVYSQKHYKDKWEQWLDNGQPAWRANNRLIPEIDWYPWASKELGFRE